jgi:NTE family protein
VTASCTVPWLFAPVAINGHEYVDGGVWSPTNLDVAPAGRDTHVLCLNPTAAINGTQALIAVARRISRSAATVETLALRSRGAAVLMIAPDLESAGEMGSNLMNREPQGRVLAAGYRQGLRLAEASTAH